MSDRDRLWADLADLGVSYPVEIARGLRLRGWVRLADADRTKATIWVADHLRGLLQHGDKDAEWIVDHVLAAAFGEDTP